MPVSIDIDLQSDSYQEVATGRLSLFTPVREVENVVGTNYSDTIRGNGIANYLYGGQGHDILYGNSLSDVLEGGVGDDWYNFYGELSTDSNLLALKVVEEDGNGFDTLSFFDLEHAAYVNLNHVPNIEEVTGTDFDDIFIVSPEILLVNGYSGNDQYRFRGHEEPNISVIAEDEEAGTDTLDFSGMFHGVDVDLSAYPLTEIENVLGSYFDDTLTGNMYSEVLQGSRGNDTYKFIGDGPIGIVAVAENSSEGVDILDFSGRSPTSGGIVFDMRNTPHIESLVGTSSADTITGNALDNLIVAGGGNDWLQGREGVDTLDGGADTDTYSLLTGETLHVTDIVIDTSSYLVAQAGGVPHAAPRIELSGNTNSLGQYATLPDNAIVLATISDADTSLSVLISNLQLSGIDEADISISPTGVISWTPDLLEESNLSDVTFTIADAEGLSQSISLRAYVAVGTDSDDDGLSDAREQQLGTNSLSQDTDGDRLSDFFESRYGLDYLDDDQNDNSVNDLEEDFDNDGLVNLEEDGYGTDPDSADTDGDSISDYDEIDQGSDPLDPSDDMPPDDDNVTWFSGGLNFEEFTLTLGDQKIIGATEYYEDGTYGLTNWFDVPLERGRSYRVELEAAPFIEYWPDHYPVYVGSVPSSYPIYLWAEGGDPFVVEDPDIPGGYGSQFYGEATIWLPIGNMTAYRPMQTTGGYGPFEKTEVPEGENVGIRINGDNDAGKENDLIEVTIEALPGDYDHFALERGSSELILWRNANRTNEIPFLEGEDRTDELDVGADGKLTVYVEWVGPNHGTAGLSLVDTFGNVFDTLTFDTLNTMFIGFSGETAFGMGIPALDQPTFDIAKDLYEEGYDSYYYDVGDHAVIVKPQHPYSIIPTPGFPEEFVGPALKDAMNATNLSQSLAVYGWSHGGGATLELLKELDRKRILGEFAGSTVAATAYIDAVQFDSYLLYVPGVLNPFSETERPSAVHANWYQTNLDPFHGASVPGSEINADVTQDAEMMSGQDHVDIVEIVAGTRGPGQEPFPKLLVNFFKQKIPSA